MSQLVIHEKDSSHQTASVKSVTNVTLLSPSCAPGMVHSYLTQFWRVLVFRFGFLCGTLRFKSEYFGQVFIIVDNMEPCL